MDPQLVFAVPGVSGGAGRARRVQWQVHVQSICIARRVLRHVADAHSQNLSEFLSTRKTVAIHGDPFSTRSFVNEKFTEAAKKILRDEVVAGLSESPRQLPCKFFYDEQG